MTTRLVPLLLLVVASTGGSVSAQTSKYLPGDTLVVPPATSVEFIGGGGITVSDTLRAVLVGKKYPYWFVDFDLANGSIDSTKVGNSFLQVPGVVNVSLQSRDQGLEQNRKLSRLGVDVAKVGGRVQQAIDELAAGGVPVLLKFSFETNAEGGVEPKVRVYNISDKRIRTISVEFSGFDEQGVLVPCSKSGKTSHTVSVNGPIDPDAECYYAFVNAPIFFNDATACLEIDRVMVEFTDGESLILKENLVEIQDLLKNPFMRHGECPG